jgi:hypothetical protein
MAARRAARHAETTDRGGHDAAVQAEARSRVLKCAGCGEIAPEGALECSMCGEELDPKRSVALQASGGEAREVGRHWA